MARKKSIEGASSKDHEVISNDFNDQGNIFAPAVYYKTAKNPGQIISDDFNKDGNLDLALTNMESGQASIFLGNGNGVFKASYNYAVGSYPQGLTKCDFNNDGNLDLAVSLQSDAIAILMGYGNGTFHIEQKYTLSGTHFGIIANDFNKDGNCDFATVNRVTGGNVDVVLGDGNGGFKLAQIYSGYNQPSWLDYADLNNDGTDDIVFTNYESASLSVLLNSGNGTFKAGSSFDIQSYPSFLTIKDFNNDGNHDIAASNAGSHSVSVLLGKGDGTFQTAVNYPIDGNWTSMVGAADFNQDGKLDIVANAQFSDFVTVLLGNGDGTFQTTATQYQSTGQPCLFSIGDFNQDSKPDLAIPNYSSNNVSVLLNTAVAPPPPTGTCVLLTEASSSKTAFFSYSVSYNGTEPLLTKNLIEGQSKYVLKREKIDEYAQGVNGKDAADYYSVMTNPVIMQHIKDQSCNLFDWGLLATGGMRDNVEPEVAQSFYGDIKNQFNTNSPGAPKKVNLVKAMTITGEDEGMFAWLTLKAEQNIDYHAVVDLGGATMQFANKTLSNSWSLGKQTTANNLANTIQGCYNDENNDQGKTHYDGSICRGIIDQYLGNYTLTNVDYSQYVNSKFFTISNFYLYFNDVCGTYLPAAEDGKFSMNSATLSQVQQLCDIKSKGDQSLVMGIKGYQNITDEVCVYWGKDWDVSNTKYFYARDICFSGNYNYQLLKEFGLEDKHQIHISFSGDQVYIDKADWDLGAAYDILDSCNYPKDHSVDVKYLNGKNGFMIRDEVNQLGAGAASTGDVNGDGLADIMVRSANTPTTVYVIYGSEDAYPPVFDVSILNGKNGFNIYDDMGINEFIKYGMPGDINGDGYDDIQIGISTANSIQGYILYGSDQLPTQFKSSQIDGSNGFYIQSTLSGGGIGKAIGDLNHDGLDDFSIGYGSSIIFGSKHFPKMFNAMNLDGSNGFKLVTSEGQGGGGYAAGDFNNDGIDDIFVGFGRFNGNPTGYAYVIYGQKTFPASIDLSSLTSAQGVKLNGVLAKDKFGFSGGKVGDFNNDGIDDVFVGATSLGNQSMGFVFFGGNNLPAEIDATNLNGTNGFSIGGFTADDKFGFSMFYNGKSFYGAGGSFGVSAWGIDNNAGATYIINADGYATYPSKVNITDTSILNPFVVSGLKANSLLGWGSSGGADINGDGINDSAAAAPGNNTFDNGVYVIFGRDACQADDSL